MELVLKQTPFVIHEAELVVMDRTPAECFKMHFLQEVFVGTKIRITPASQLNDAEWSYDGINSKVFSVGIVIRDKARVVVEGPLVAQLSFQHSTSLMDGVYASASYGIKFTENSISKESAMVIRDDMVCYRQGNLTWILGGSLDKTGEVSESSLELGAVAAVAVALGASAKIVASGLRRFRAGPFALLERRICTEALV